MFLWPNWIRRLTTNQKIGGSSPSRNTFLFFFQPTNQQFFFLCVVFPLTGAFADIAQLGERQTEDLKVPGSIPGGGTFCYPARAGPRRIPQADWISTCGHLWSSWL